METMLYFAEGGGADATTEAAMYPASSFLGVEPHDATNTYIYFDSPMGDVDGGGGVGDDGGGCGRHIYYVLNTSEQMIDFLNGDKFDKIKESVLFSQRQISDKPLNYIPLSVIE